MKKIKYVVCRAMLAAVCVAVSPTILAGLAGCTAGGGDTVVDTCEKMDQCNALAPGVGVGTCVEELDTDLNGLPPSERVDFENLLDGCLRFESCNAFLDCLD